MKTSIVVQYAKNGLITKDFGVRIDKAKLAQNNTMPIKFDFVCFIKLLSVLYLII